jgi:hypothetical protein
VTELGDRVLHLQPGVHLEEEELGLVAVQGVAGDEELDRAGALVPDRTRGLDGALRPSAPAGRRRPRGRASPRRPSGADAGPSTPVRAGAPRDRGGRRRPAPRCGVGCDTSRSRMTRSSPNAARASRRAAASASGSSSGSWTARMPLPPPPATALTSSGNPTSAGGRDERLVVEGVVVDPGHDRDARLDQPPLGRGLVAHQPDDVRRRADEGQPGGGDRLGEGGVLGQEPVAGVDGVAARRERRVDQRRSAGSSRSPGPGRGGRQRRPRTWGSPASASE